MADTTEEAVVVEIDGGLNATDIRQMAAEQGGIFGFFLLATVINGASLVHTLSSAQAPNWITIGQLVGLVASAIVTFGMLFGFIGWLVGLHLEATSDEEMITNGQHESG